MSALWGLLRKETLHILRDRRTLVVLLLLPVLQVVIFGYAIRTDVEDVRLAVVDPSPDYATLRLRARLTAAHVFRVVAVLHETAPLSGLRTGEAQAALVPSRLRGPPGTGLPAQLLVITDTTEPNTGVTIRTTCSASRSVEGRSRARGGVRIVPRPLRFNPTAESKNPVRARPHGLRPRSSRA